MKEWKGFSWVVWCVLAVVAVFSSDSAFAASKRALWESRDQFVAIESQDAVKGGAKIPNQHPADISQERLGEILNAINVRSDENKTPIPLFTKGSLDVLIPNLQDAFRQAAANEDVTFAVIGLYTSAYGLTRSPKVVSGRMFYQEGKINLIVGKAQYKVNERQDRRLDPFTPGSREYPAEADWTLLPQQGQPALTMARKDWIVFANDWKPVADAVPVADKATGDQASPAAALNKLFSGKAGKAAERLTVLKELRDKGVITEEEYRTKRLTILNEL